MPSSTTVPFDQWFRSGRGVMAVAGDELSQRHRRAVAVHRRGHGSEVRRSHARLRPRGGEHARRRQPVDRRHRRCTSGCFDRGDVLRLDDHVQQARLRGGRRVPCARRRPRRGAGPTTSRPSTSGLGRRGRNDRAHLGRRASPSARAGGRHADLRRLRPHPDLRPRRRHLRNPDRAGLRVHGGRRRGPDAGPGGRPDRPRSSTRLHPDARRGGERLRGRPPSNSVRGRKPPRRTGRREVRELGLGRSRRLPHRLRSGQPVDRLARRRPRSHPETAIRALRRGCGNRRWGL